jgi:hypothetical protein
LTVVNDQEIIRTIGYITDDKYIASYHGVDVRRVIALRKQVSEHKAKAKVARAIYVSDKTAPSGINSDSERKWNANAREGSAKLRDALFAFFEKRMLEKAGLERGNG